MLYWDVCFVLINEAGINILEGDVATNIISIFALFVAICTAVFSYVQNKKINKINIEANMLIDVYRGYLLEEIPRARKYIHYSNKNILSGTDNLVSVLNEIRRSSLFFMYKDSDFYKKLCNALQGLEDNLIEKEGFLSIDEFSKFENEVDKSIENIYNLIIKEISS